MPVVVFLPQTTALAAVALVLSRACAYSLAHSYMHLLIHSLLLFTRTDLGMIYDWFREVSRHLDVNVLAYDYDGYGLSEGAPSEKGVYADIEAAFNYLTDVLSVPPDRVILYGRSLGSGPSCHLAMKQSKEGKPVRGVILQSPVMSAYRVAFHFRFSMPGDLFCNIDKVPHIRSPIFIMHGRRDEVVPFWHGQELYLATQPQFQADPFWVESAGESRVPGFCSCGHCSVYLLLRTESPPPSFPHGQDD